MPISCRNRSAYVVNFWTVVVWIFSYFACNGFVAVAGFCWSFERFDCSPVIRSQLSSCAEHVVVISGVVDCGASLSRLHLFSSNANVWSWIIGHSSRSNTGDAIFRLLFNRLADALAHCSDVQVSLISGIACSSSQWVSWLFVMIMNDSLFFERIKGQGSRENWMISSLEVPSNKCRSVDPMKKIPNAHEFTRISMDSNENVRLIDNTKTFCWNSLALARQHDQWLFAHSTSLYSPNATDFGYSVVHVLCYCWQSGSFPYSSRPIQVALCEPYESSAETLRHTDLHLNLVKWHTEILVLCGEC